MDNETKIAVSFNNTVKNLDQVTKYERELQKIYGYVSALKNPKATQALKEMDNTAKKLDKEVKEQQKDTKKLGDMLSTAFSVKVLEGFTKGIFKLGKGMFQLSQKTSEYVENVNLLEVAYRNANETIEQSSKRIETYIDKMAEAYGLDESRLTRQFGIFKQLANAMQLPTETAENLSEIMVKMTNDIASLYNLDLNRASNALQSALAGQVRPIRSATGADITEKTLQTTVDALGLDRTINQLSYVEKRLVMVISLTNQLKASQGDYARTIESSANQIRVMQEQWDRLSRAFGNVFYPILQKVLPWINGILMALTEIFNLLASFLGFKMPEFDYSGLVGVSDLAQDIEDELGGAGEAVDNLANKLKGLRSFDKLNVINTPSASSAGGVAGGGVGGIGNIDPKIMDAFNKAFGEYDDMMGKVQMKAEKIRDNIMEWLGFTKEINPLTGEISWKFDHITAGTVLGGLAVGGFIYTGISKIFKMLTALTGIEFPWLATLGKVVGVGVAGIGLAELISTMDWYQNLTGNQGDLFTMWGKIITGYQDIQKQNKTTNSIYDATTTNYAKMLAEMQESGNYDEEFYQRTLDALYDNMLYQAGIGNKSGIATAMKGGQYDLIKGQVDEAYQNILNNLDMYSSSAYSLFGGITDDNVVAMNNYTNAVTKYFDAITENLPNVSSFSNIISQMKESSNEASEGFENLLAKFADANYDITLSDLDTVNVYLQQLKTSADTSSQAFYDAILKITLGLQEQGWVAEETAEKVIDSAYRKRLAEEGETQAFIDKMAELERQYRNNEITEKEYYRQAVLIYQEFKKSSSALQILKGKIDVFNSSLKISADSWDNVAYNLQTTKGYFDETIASMNAQYDENLEYLLKLRNAYDENTEDYKEIQKDIDALTRQNTYSMEEATEAYKMYLLNTFKAINESTERDSKEAKQYMKSINDELSKYGVEVDLSAGKENINKQIDDFQKSIEGRHPKIVVEGEINKEGFRNIFRDIGYRLANMPSIGGISFSGMAPAFYNLMNAFYAQGGLPPVGQIFIANERGPELVGQIGGQSFVANQNQMMDLLDKKIGNAQNNQPKIFNIYLDADHKIGSYTLDQLQDMAKTNGQAITIG